MSIDIPPDWEAHPSALNTDEHYTLVISAPLPHGGPMTGFLIESYNDDFAEEVQIWNKLKDSENPAATTAAGLVKVSDLYYIYPNPDRPFRISKYNHYSMDHLTVLEKEMDKVLEKAIDSVIILEK